MRYFDSLTFITHKQGWFLNLALCGVCLLIPVIGQIVVLGYSFEVFDALHRDPEKKAYPKFEFDRFTQYLMRGAWPFLVLLIFNTLVAIPIAIIAVLTVGLMAATHGRGAVVVLVWPIFALVVFAIQITAAMFITTMATYAGVAQKLDFSGMFAFASSVVRTTFKELLFSLIFGFVAAWVLGLVGFVACCVGTLLASAAIQLMIHHLSVQIYELYLERGGAAIPEPSRRV